MAPDTEGLGRRGGARCPPPCEPGQREEQGPSLPRGWGFRSNGQRGPGPCGLADPLPPPEACRARTGRVSLGGSLSNRWGLGHSQPPHERVRPRPRATCPSSPLPAPRTDHECQVPPHRPSAGLRTAGRPGPSLWHPVSPGSGHCCPVLSVSAAREVERMPDQPPRLSHRPRTARPPSAQGRAGLPRGRGQVSPLGA